MAKKQSIREQREAKKAAQKQKFSAAQTTKAEIKAASQLSVTVDEPETVKKNEKPIKSRNKAAGLKSTLVSGKNVYLTSFGKGNEAIVEHEIRTDKEFAAVQVTDNVTLIVSGANDEAVSFSGTRTFTGPDILRADNPLHTPASKPTPKTGQDMLGLKDKLEMRYYGRTFDDNLHIQIIYNILDIEKILAVHITNAAAALDHMFGGLLGEKEDFIGYMSTMNTYEVFMDPSKDAALDSKTVDNINASRSRFERLLNTKRLGYFGFEYNPRAENAEEQKKRIYHLMGIIGQLRQWAFHDLYQTWLYQLSNHLDAEYLQTLDDYFGRRFREINDDFLNQNKVNLLILKDSFKNIEPAGLAQLYYDFIVLKAHKNLGFSLKKLREMMLDRADAADFRDQEMNSVRSKLYKLIDFCLFYYFKSHGDKTAAIVSDLRTCMLETDKETVYSREATLMWNQYHSVFRSFLNELRGEQIKKYQKMMLPDEMTKSHLLHLRDSNISPFSKLIYALCLFLDGKEINDLLTTLLNKFDIIANMNTCAEELGIKAPFVPEYVFFEDSKLYVAEMSIVKNIARMTKPQFHKNVNKEDNSSKNESLSIVSEIKPEKELFRDALTILGFSAEYTEDNFEQEIEQYLKTGKTVKHDYRNFILNNVIKSSRFIYVIKFCNPQTAHSIVKNKNVTQFVLSQMPQEQINRYFNNCCDESDTCSIKKKIQRLSEIISKIDYSVFKNVNNAPESNDTKSQKEKERYKAIIRLYLTVIYLVVKNLVNINARYIIAFYCLERDANLYDVKIKDENTPSIKNYTKLVETLCQEGDSSRSGYLARNKHMRQCVSDNIANSQELFIQGYRNAIAHLNFIRSCDKWICDIGKISSYYALYQYLVQHYMKDEDRNKQHPYYSQVERYKTYVKDLVKALNVPFGYNIPRFKNLTIEQLFDRNCPIINDDTSNNRMIQSLNN